MPERMKVHAKSRQNEQLIERLGKQLNDHQVEHQIGLIKTETNGSNSSGSTDCFNIFNFIFNYENSTEKAWQLAGIRVMDISLLLKSGWKDGGRCMLRRIYLRDGLPCRIIVSTVVPGGIPA